MSTHAIHRIIDLEPVGPFELSLRFEDGVERSIDFSRVVGRGLYAPLSDPDYFARVALDAEAGTIVWPNGADFDPAILHDWPSNARAMERLVASWGD